MAVDIYLHNTLTGKKELFKSIKKNLFGRPKVSMYHCGPTVYNYPHIGNLRAYVFADTLKRLFKATGYNVKQVINITDVGHLTSDADTGEDKIEKAKKRESKSAWDIAKFYADVFFDNLNDLNIDTTGTQFPRATQFIKQQIDIIRQLEKKGFTYKTSDGIYFDTAKFPAYGKLGNIDIHGLREGERIGVNDEKKNPTDFALWKFSPNGEKRDMEWPSPWGVGFPGWHIECSAMSASLLGIPVDIHTGGIDHIPVHHNNEIAQSEAAFGRQFVRFWLHSAFVNIAGGKMAKSEDNFVTLETLKKKGYDPLMYRYFLLGARYSTQLNFTWEALDAAATAYKRFVTTMVALPPGGKVNKDLYNKALSYMADDLDTPKVLALSWDILKDESISPADRMATLGEIGKLLGFDRPYQPKNEAISNEVLTLVKERELARTDKNWKKSDELRDKIKALGYEVKDTPEGQKLSPI